MITRKQYMRRQATHREYYAQFVDHSVKHWVLAVIGIERLLKCTDPRLNDISLQTWDRYHGLFCMSKAGRDCAKANEGGGVSLSDAVCVAKEAARQLIEQRTGETKWTQNG